MKLFLLALIVGSANAANCPVCTEAVCTAANTANSNTLLGLKAASDFPAAGCAAKVCTAAECCEYKNTCANITNAATAVAATQTTGCGGAVAAVGWTIKSTLPTTKLTAQTDNAKRLACCDLTATCTNTTGAAAAGGADIDQAKGCGGTVQATGWTLKTTIPATALTGAWVDAGNAVDMTPAGGQIENGTAGQAAALRLNCCDFTANCTNNNGAAGAGTDPSQTAACGGTVAAVGWTLKTTLPTTAMTGAFVTAGGGFANNAASSGEAGNFKRKNCCDLTATCTNTTGAAAAGGADIDQAKGCGGAINVTGWTIKSTIPATALTGAWVDAGNAVDMTPTGGQIENGTAGQAAALRLNCCDFTGSCTATEGTAAGTDPNQTQACGGTVAATGYTLKTTIPGTAMTHAHITAGGAVTMNAAGANADEKAVKAANCCDEGTLSCTHTTVVTGTAVPATQATHCGGAATAAGAWVLKTTLPATQITGLTLTSTATDKATKIKEACCDRDCTPLAVASPAGVAAPGVVATLLAAVAVALRM